MTLRLQPIKVATNSNDTDGLLVFRDVLLVALLMRLSDDHGDDVGRWFLETSYGLLQTMCPPVFADLDEAEDWIEHQLRA